MFSTITLIIIFGIKLLLNILLPPSDDFSVLAGHGRRTQIDRAASHASKIPFTTGAKFSGSSYLLELDLSFSGVSATIYTSE